MTVKVKMKVPETKGIRAQFLPSHQPLQEELISPLEIEDPIGDEVHSPLPGLVHRYPDRILFKPTHSCVAPCSFCFRRDKILKTPDFELSKEEILRAHKYIQSQTQVVEVILSGGDPLMMSKEKLALCLKPLYKIKHLTCLRIHTRVPTLMPRKILDSTFLPLPPPPPKNEYPKILWVVCHINSADELTPLSRKAIRSLALKGVPLMSQSVLLKGINTSLEQLKHLLLGLISSGIKPYYLHYPDLVRGTNHFRIPLDQAIDLLRKLRGQVPGYAIPHLVIDIPGGKGKITVDHNWIVKRLGNHSFRVQSPLTGEELDIHYPPC